MPTAPRTAVTTSTESMREREVTALSGWPALGGILLTGVLGVLVIVWGAMWGSSWVIVSGCVILLAGFVGLFGLTSVAPGEARVLQLLGRYVGTVRVDGLRWVNPLCVPNRISTRIRNHETSVMKVNDADGNPIEIAAVVVWQVRDTARATFEVDDFVEFVTIQTEAAVRHIASCYAYEQHEDNSPSLRRDAEHVAENLSEEVAARVEAAGVTILESRLTHLAYAPEIAHAMLRRQQANAVVSARRQVVEGAVGMVELALDHLTDRKLVEFDQESKAAMVSNLLVVLCSDRDTQPIVNSGTNKLA